MQLIGTLDWRARAVGCHEAESAGSPCYCDSFDKPFANVYEELTHRVAGLVHIRAIVLPRMGKAPKYILRCSADIVDTPVLSRRILSRASGRKIDARMKSKMLQLTSESGSGLIDLTRRALQVKQPR